jgi:hypothetical protein
VRQPYLHHPDHRNATHGKSQWTITKQEELASFHVAHSSGWITGVSGWGLYTPAGVPEWLGTAQDHVRRVFLAKFVSSSTPVTWHGYPADHQVNAQDIPNERILNDWLTKGLFRPAKLRKLARGQACGL